MKKTITLPNGKVIVLEGTPEEIAAYERGEKIAKVTKKPTVLRGSEKRDPFCLCLAANG